MEFFSKARVLMLCGALHDVAEKSKEHHTKKQIIDIELKIESIVEASLSIQEQWKVHNSDLNNKQ